MSAFWGCCSVVQSCLILCNPMDFSVLHYLPEFAQTRVQWVSDAIQPSHLLLPHLSSCPQSFPASGSFPMSQLFASGGQSIGASVSALVLPKNIQGWFPFGLTGLISLQSRELSRVFSEINRLWFISCMRSRWFYFYLILKIIYLFLAIPTGMLGLSSLIRSLTHTPCTESMEF